MRVVVTGGAGFIGSHLVDRLLSSDENKVLVLDDLSVGRKEYVHSSAEFVQTDVTQPKVIKLIKDFKPDTVFHLAAHKNVRVSLQRPEFDAQVNVFGSLQVFRAAQEVQAKVAFTSTVGVYGDNNDLPLSEKAEIKPMAPYPIHKLTAEHYLNWLSNEGLSAVSLRLSNVYGPRQDAESEGGVVAIFFNGFLHDQPTYVFGDGKQTRDFVYVDDVVEALQLAGKSEVSGVYNIGTCQETTINSLWQKQMTVAGVERATEYKPAVEGEILRSAIDYGLARQRLNWQPRITLADGLSRTYEWFKNNQI